jgi:hypothetical protein
MHLRNGRSAGKSAYLQNGATSKVMVASRPNFTVPRQQHQSRKLWISPCICTNCTWHGTTLHCHKYTAHLNLIKCKRL